MPRPLEHLLVDARAIAHPTAGAEGVGRHVTSLLAALASSDVPATALVGSEDERRILARVAPGLPVRPLTPGAIAERAADGSHRPWFLATQLMLHPPSLDPVPAAVTSAGLPVAALLYDVIPYRDPERYLRADTPRLHARLRRALAHTVDLLLANSDFVARTAVAEVGLDPGRIAVVGAAPDPLFGAPSPPGSGRVRPPRALVAADDGRALVVAVTGGANRKNTPNLLRAWGRLDERTRAGRVLAVIGGHSPNVRRQWDAIVGEHRIGGSVVIAGRVDDETLVGALRAAELAVVPSLEEGFGLPVVEAAACGCPVVCSDTSSLPEVLDDPAARFDPTDPAAMATVIGWALDDPAGRERAELARRRTVERWTWPQVVGDIVRAFERHAAPGRLAGPSDVAVRWAIPRSVTAGIRGDGGRFGDDDRLVEVLVDLDGGHRLVDRPPFDPLAIGPYWGGARFEHVVVVPPHPWQVERLALLARATRVHLLVPGGSAVDVDALAPLLPHVASVVVGPNSATAHQLEVRTAAPVHRLAAPADATAVAAAISGRAPGDAGTPPAETPSSSTTDE